jgi:predicted Fe-Mo cluster-binding NifX family protein
MKVCISSSGTSLDSLLDPRFGRANYFIIVDTDNMEFDVIENPGASAGGGAGITAAQLIIDRGAEALITGNLGPNAMSVLSAANIGIYRGITASVRENIDSFKKGLLERISSTVPPHYGMRFRGGQK